MENQAANKKRIAKNTLYLYIRMGLAMIVGLYTSRIVLNTLGVEDFGIYNVVAGIVVVFTFVSGALSTVTTRFITIELGRKNDVELLKYFNCSFYLHLLVALFIVFLCESIGLWFVMHKLVIPEGRMFSALIVYQISILSLVFTIMSVPLNADIIAHEEMNIYAIMGIVSSLLTAGMVILLQYINYDKLILYSLIIFLIQFITFIFLFFFCKVKYSECTYHIIRSKQHYKDMLSFMGWDLIGNLSTIIQTQGVNVLLNMFGGVVLNTARGISYQVEGNLRRFSDNFMTALKPQIIKLYAQKDYEAMWAIVFNGCKISFLLFSVFAVPMFIETKYVLLLWLKQVPEYTVPFTRIILLIGCEFVIFYPFLMVVLATGKIKWINIFVGMLLMLSFPVIYVVLKIGLSPIYAFIVLLIFRNIADFTTYFILKRYIQMSIFNIIKQVYLPCYLVFSISIILSIIIKSYFDMSLMRLLLVICFSTLTLLLLGYSFLLHKTERQMVKRLLKQKIVKK